MSLDRFSSPASEAKVAELNQRQAEGTRARILASAARLIGERGFRSVRISDIAKDLGVSSGIVHYHFSGKDDLLDAALVYAVDRAFDRQERALGPIEDSRDRLLRLIELQLPKAGEIRDEWSIWVQFWAEAAVRPELRAEQRRLYDAWHDKVQRAIERGQADGVFRTSMDPEVVTQRVTAMTDGLAIQYLTGSKRINIVAMRELLVQFIEEQLFVD